MYCKVFCATLVGITGIVVEVEADIHEGFPTLDLVGMPGSSVREAKDRIRTAIKNAGFEFPYKRITINLAPAYLKKEGGAFDLSMAVAILACNNIVNREAVAEVMIVGELALNGMIRPVKGILSFLDAAKEAGIKQCVIPYENWQEASLCEGIDVFPLKHLVDVVKGLNSRNMAPYVIKNEDKAAMNDERGSQDIDFHEVIGQKQAKRGIEVAVSGMHHVLLEGQPGIGKSMLAKRISTILPPLKPHEVLELTKIYSAAEKLMEAKTFVTERPFRHPHHSITRASFIGGGMQVKPGEISLAHHGVLMLDECLEFKREVIESLREPLENGSVLLARSHQVYEFPCRFMLVASTNPCPCGYYPDTNKCSCLPHEIKSYKQKISGPVHDRLDLHITMVPVSYESIEKERDGESSEQIRSRVIECHSRQQHRYKEEAYDYNGQMDEKGVYNYCKTTKDAQYLLKEAYENLSLSTRAYHRVLKVSRTIADMDGKESITAEHISRALGYRTSP